MKTANKIFGIVALLCIAAPFSSAKVIDSLAVENKASRSINHAASTTGSVIYTESDIDRYPTTDIRNSLTGIIPGLRIKEVSGSPGLYFNSESSRAVMYTRGATPVLYIDGMPITASEINIDPEEIISIELVKDVVQKAALGGTRGTDGVIYITTKRTKASGHTVKAGFESGVNIIDRMPEFVNNSAEYATLSNEARVNSGYMPLYSDEMIDAYRSSNAYTLASPNINWRELIFKNTADFNKAYTQVYGGTDKFKYSAHFGYAGEGDFFTAGKNARFDKYNLRTNISSNITDDLSFDFGFYGGISMRTSPRYEDNNSLFELGKFIDATNTIPSNAFPLLISEDEDSGIKTWGVSKLYSNNPYASLLENGFYKLRSRTGTVNATLKYDMGKIIPGIVLDSYIGLEDFTMIRNIKNPDYLAKIYDPDTQTTTISSHDGTKTSGLSNNGRWYRQGIMLRERASYSLRTDKHNLDASVFALVENFDRSSYSAHERIISGVGTLKYSFMNRYVVEGTFNTTGTSVFAKGKRFGYFPSAGLAWIASNEPFMEGARSVVDLLKFRAQAGIIGGSAFMTGYLYEDDYTSANGVNYGPATTNYQWLGSSTRYQGVATTLNRLGNPDLTWEKRYELSGGVDAELLGGRLAISAEGYRRLRSGIVANTASLIPRSYGLSNVAFYENYSEYLYYGADVCATWSDRIGDFQYAIQGSLSYNEGVYMKYPELETYDYNRVTGSKIGRITGYEYLGQFSSQEEIDASFTQSFTETLKVGDLKYKDMNGDETVNTNDTKVIGNSNPKYYYALNLMLKYKGIEFTAVGTGLAGYDIVLNNEYYWNGWGDGNISAYVRDNKGTANYPTLEYVKNANNFVNSQYWMRSGSFFKLQNIELAYCWSKPSARVMKAFKAYVRGANLLTISGIKDTDPESMDSGVTAYPLCKTFTAGIKMTF